MRKQFFDSLIKCAESDPKTFLITSDLGFGAIEEYVDRFPNQFLNIGVAEQSMIGAATGLAEAGFNVYCYSISNFSFIRPWEFIRNGPLAHNLNVKIVGMGAGVDYSTDGLSHYSFDDLSLSLPFLNLRVITPATGESCEKYVRSLHNENGTIFYRLSRSSQMNLPQLVEKNLFEKRTEVEVVIACLGTSYLRGVQILEALAKRSIEGSILVIEDTSSKSIKEKINTISSKNKVVVVEDHISSGGLASRISLELFSARKYPKLICDGLIPHFTGQVGDLEFMQNKLRRNLQEIIDEII
jgi:transketolase